MPMDNGYARAEKEFLEPPDDDNVGECENCGEIVLLVESHGHICCQDCAKDRDEHFEFDDDDDWIHDLDMGARS